MIQPLLKPSQMPKRRKVARASNFPGLGTPKGPTRRAEKDAYDAEAAAFIKAMRERLFTEEPRCQDCGETQAETAARFFRNGWAWPSKHEMDEIQPRSKTRGQHYSVRFARPNVRRRCATCHMKKHGIKIPSDRK